jgi:hypothetical protein
MVRIRNKKENIMSNSTKNENNTSTVEAAPTTVVSFSPFEAAKIVNAALKEQGLDKQLPPQMFYNYTKTATSTKKDGTKSVRKPLIPTIEVDGRRRITQDVLTAWLQKYVTKLQTPAAETNESEQVTESVEA